MDVLQHADCMSVFTIQSAAPHDVPLILSFIKEIAAYEKLSHQVVATEEVLHDSLFGPHPSAEVLLGYVDQTPVCYAIFFHNFSTFLGKRGLYLEDLYVKPAYRGKGYGQTMIQRLAALARERDCGRFEWSVLDWNETAIEFYKNMGANVLPEWHGCAYRMSLQRRNDE
jgi:GNAT superfamily N-acetyltransferase